MINAAAKRAILSTTACGVALSATFLAIAPACAQESERAELSTGAAREIIVTARKREERLIDVPVAANVLNAEALERYATTSLTALGGQIPQVSLDTAPVGSGGVLTIRGIGSSISDGGIEQAVTVSIDGVPISRGRVLRSAMFDTQSLEVLKGPQALYFGKNSPGGVVSLSSVTPGDELDGYVRAGFDTEAVEYFGEGAVSVPLASGLTARLAVRGSYMDGSYMRNVAGPIADPTQLPLALALGNNLLGPPGAPVPLPGGSYQNLPGNRDIAARLTLHYGSGAGFDATFKFLYAKHKDRGDNANVTTTGCGALPAQIRTDLGGFLFLPDPYGSCEIRRKTSLGEIPAAVAASFPNSNGGKPFTEIPTYLGSLTLKLDVTPEIQLTSVTGYYDYDVKGYANFDASALALASGSNNESFTSWSQEFRIQTDFDGMFNFSGGLYYEDNKRTFDQNGMIAYLGPDLFTGRTSSIASFDKYKGKTYSAYGELNIKLLPSVELAGGARYTSEKKSADMGMTYLHFLLTGFARSPSLPRIQDNFTEDNLSPQATLSWHITPDVMLYGAYKHGFKSGGYSSPALIPPTATGDTLRFDQEKAKGGEIGLKYSLLDRRLTGDLTAYHYIYKGLQLTAFDAATTSYTVQNAGSAKIDGVEANMAFEATDALSLRGSVGYNEARYGSFAGAECWAFQTPAEGCGGGVQNLSGERLSRAPRWTASLGVSYDAPAMGSWTLGISADVRYSGGYFTSVQNSPFAKQGDYMIADAGVRLYNDAWEFAVIGKNLADRIYVTVGGDTPLAPRGQTFGALNTPRQIILQATRRF